MSAVPEISWRERIWAVLANHGFDPQHGDTLCDDLLTLTEAIVMEESAAWNRDLTRVAAEGERDLEKAIEERDQLHEWADRLAYAIAPQSVIGEHSSANNPWQNAIDVATSGEVRP